MKFKNYSLNVRDLIFLAVILAAAFVSLIFWIATRPGSKAVFIYETSDSKSLSIERRFMKGKPVVSRTRAYIDELLLGPISEHCRPVFQQGTKVLSCFERDRVLYVNLSSDMVKNDSPDVDFKRQMELFKKNIHSNFPSIKKVELFIDGNEPYAY